jgi:imidazolonepropionase-like amidohydrolase
MVPGVDPGGLGTPSRLWPKIPSDSEGWRYGIRSMVHALAFIGCTLVCGAPCGLGRDSITHHLVLEGGTTYTSPGEEPLRGGVVLIEGDTIMAVGPKGRVPIPPNAQVIDCTGCTVTAGFWNSHVHFFERKWSGAGEIPGPELAEQLREMGARFGFTHVFDLSSAWENTRRIRDRIRSTGEGLIAAGAAPSDQVLGVMGLMKTALPEITDAAQAAAESKRLIQSGVDGIKLFLKRAPSASASFPTGAIQSAVAEAHRLGKPVFVHPSTGDDVRAAVAACVDVIAHTTPHSGPWDDAVVAHIKARRVALTPMLELWKHFSRHDRLSAQRRTVDVAVGQLRAWLAAGGTVLFGTDLGAVENDPLDEYILMQEAGMDFRQILASPTTTPAQFFHESERHGRVVVGLRADVVVLRGDPAQDVQALTDVRLTVRGGTAIFQAEGTSP